MKAKKELIQKKKEDILGALNLAVIGVDRTNDVAELCRIASETMKMLATDIDALERIDDFLELQELILGDN